MKVSIEQTGLADCLIVTSGRMEDSRGFFSEVFRADEYAAAGLPLQVVQLNHSRSERGVVRGLHFQWEPPMGKLMRVLTGRAFLVAVDIRKGSPTFGKWFGRTFEGSSRELLWAPAGFARGFAVESDVAEIEYLTTGTYNAAGEAGFAFNDPVIGVRWPVSDPIISDRDAKAMSFTEWIETPQSNHFTYPSAS